MRLGIVTWCLVVGPVRARDVLQANRAVYAASLRAFVNSSVLADSALCISGRGSSYSSTTVVFAAGVLVMVQCNLVSVLHVAVLGHLDQWWGWHCNGVCVSKDRSYT